MDNEVSILLGTSQGTLELPHLKTLGYVSTNSCLMVAQDSFRGVTSTASHPGLERIQGRVAGTSVRDAVGSWVV